jgi:putative ABC transport system substrate-binding protein
MGRRGYNGRKLDKPAIDYHLGTGCQQSTRTASSIELGGMMSFGPDSANAGQDCARVVAEIFNGANPANIPISQPTKYELCFNLNTAKAPGIEIPPSLLVQADKVIE